MIVSSSTMKPQNVAACAAPGHRPLQQLALPDHLGSLRPPRPGPDARAPPRPAPARAARLNASRFSHHSRRPAIASATTVRTRPTVIRKTTRTSSFPELKRSGGCQPMLVPQCLHGQSRRRDRESVITPDIRTRRVAGRRRVRGVRPGAEGIFDGENDRGHVDLSAKSFDGRTPLASLSQLQSHTRTAHGTCGRD